MGVRRGSIFYSVEVEEAGPGDTAGEVFGVSVKRTVGEVPLGGEGDDTVAGVLESCG